MAWELHNGRRSEAFKAGVAIAARKPVKVGTVVDEVLLATANTDSVLGITDNVASAGLHITVYQEGNVCKAVAAASLGFGANVGIASTNGDFGPVAAASGSAKVVVGQARTSAAAGETFSLYVNPSTTDAQV